jgi:protein-L-isoaspartate(D-aspartate) O-methyltransferase
MARFPSAGRLVRDPRVLAALEKVRRGDFLPPEMGPSADADEALPIGWGQTVSQPSLVAHMIELLELRPGGRVLEVGTGCGYETALLAELAGAVFSVEIIEELSLGARAVLARLGYGNVSFRVGDGALGWPEQAPFDAAVVACAPERVPPALVEQLEDGGRLVLPLSTGEAPWEGQRLLRLRKTGSGVVSEDRLGVSFVPMRGDWASRNRRGGSE